MVAADEEIELEAELLPDMHFSIWLCFVRPDCEESTAVPASLFEPAREEPALFLAFWTALACALASLLNRQTPKLHTAKQS